MQLREKYRIEPLETESSVFDFEMATKNLKSQKSPSIDQIWAELITAGVEQFALDPQTYEFYLG